MKNTNILSGWREAIENLVPGDGQEEREKRMILDLMDREGERLLFRDCDYAHLTASAIVVNRARTRTLMAYHKIYNSWAWTGGHADGDSDPQVTARREAEEETGISGLRLLGNGAMSVEILPVWAHVKRGAHVGSHLHLNVSYVYEADDGLPLRIAPEENSSIGWLPVDRLAEYVTEPPMLPIYARLLRRANDY